MPHHGTTVGYSLTEDLSEATEGERAVMVGGKYVVVTLDSTVSPVMPMELVTDTSHLATHTHNSRQSQI